MERERGREEGGERGIEWGRDRGNVKETGME